MGYGGSSAEECYLCACVGVWARGECVKVGKEGVGIVTRVGRLRTT